MLAVNWKYSSDNEGKVFSFQELIKKIYSNSSQRSSQILKIIYFLMQMESLELFMKGKKNHDETSNLSNKTFSFIYLAWFVVRTGELHKQ